jgi:hypothetical protein
MSARNVRVFALCMLVFGAVVLAQTTSVRLPGNNQGYEPEQPIAYSHRLHAGELGIDCFYCHFGARTSRHAGIPSASVCMNCHKHVTAPFDDVLQERVRAELEGREPAPIVSAEMRKLYDALGLGEDLVFDPDATPAPIEWVRVHNLPDFVFFDHSVHVARGVACQTCHGPVEGMERVSQFSDLSMGWCMDCHRGTPAQLDGSTDEHVSTDCAACHY